MHTINIDASRWNSIDDFYDAILAALGSPDWHGRSLNALFDSILGGGINEAEPPYKIVIGATGNLDREILDHLETARFYLAKARIETRELFDRDVEATIELVD